MSRVLGDVSCDLDLKFKVTCDLDLKFKVKGQILYFLVNASPHKLLDVCTTSNLACA